MGTKKQFEDFWKKHYDNTPPIGYMLREYLYEDKWFRIHSLPNSKRYADSDSEMQIILDRQNTLVNDLIGIHHDYLLLFYAFSEKPISLCFPEIHNATALDSIRLDMLLPEQFDEECYLCLSLINKIWEAGSVNNYLEQIANNGAIIDLNDCDSYHILIIDMKQNRVLAPYDGGVDVFLNTSQERDIFKAKYTNWLSFTESGL